jgi:hypothetical protein
MRESTFELLYASVPAEQRERLRAFRANPCWLSRSQNGRGTFQTRDSARWRARPRAKAPKTLYDLLRNHAQGRFSAAYAARW